MSETVVNKMTTAEIKPIYFNILLKILLYTGIDVQPVQGNIAKPIYRIYSIFMQTYMCIFTTTEFIETVFFTTDFYVMSFGLCYLITHILGTLKFLLVFFQRKTIYNYTLKMETGLLNPNLQRGGQVEFAFLKRAIRGFNFQGSLFCGWAVVTIFARAMSAALDKGYDVDVNNVTVHEYTLPYTTWSPFEQNRSPWYNFFFVYQVIPLLTYGFYIGSIDALICGFFMLFKAQFLILARSLDNLIERTRRQANDDGVSLLDESARTLAEEHARDCVRHHEELIEFCDNVEDVFCYIILMQFLSSLFIFCMSLFQLSILDDWTSFEFFSMTSYLFLMMFQLFCFCYHANEVTLVSGLVSSYAFNIDWWITSEKSKKILLLMMMRSQRPCVFTAGKFAFLSLQTFMTIIRGSASYFIFLKQLST